MSTYTTVLGDTWDMIAFKICGNEKHAEELVNVNLNYVKTVIFSAGTVLNVPDIEINTEDYSSLPPWKGGINAGT